MKVSRVNDDMLVATSDGLYMTLRRLKRDAEARQALEPIREQMDVLENGAYHARLLTYKGLRTLESVLNLNTADDVQIATQGYGSATGISSTAIARKRKRSGCDAWFLNRSFMRSAARRSCVCGGSSSATAPTCW